MMPAKFSIKIITYKCMHWYSSLKHVCFKYPKYCKQILQIYNDNKYHKYWNNVSRTLYVEILHESGLSLPEMVVLLDIMGTRIKEHPLKPLERDGKMVQSGSRGQPRVRSLSIKNYSSTEHYAYTVMRYYNAYELHKVMHMN